MVNKTKVLLLSGNDYLISMLNTFSDRYDIVNLDSDGMTLDLLADHIEDFKPDMIIMDISLPSAENIEMALGIRLRCDTPILMLTSWETPRDTVRYFDPNESSLLSKPINKRDLLMQLDVILRQN